MTMLTLGEASRLVGVSKSTLARAIKAGRMSAASRRDDGSYEIDPAELTRCFPPSSGGNGGATGSMTQYATPDATAATDLIEAHARAELAAHARADLAEQRLSDLKNMLDDMRAQRDDARDDRDRWRRQAETNQRLLTHATATAARPWWRRLAG
jgi:hypothetical protein